MLKSFSTTTWNSARTLAFAIALAISGNAQPLRADDLTRAAELNDQGRYAETLRLIEPLLASDMLGHDDGLIAIIWNLRGVALQGLGKYENARQSYENAIRILRKNGHRQDEFATVLDNLGSLKALTGELQESKSLRQRALRLNRSTNQHASAARTCTSLALLAVAVRNEKDARRFIEEASREESMLPQQSFADLASIESARALVYELKRNHAAALAAMNRAIELWTRLYGPTSYPVGIGYGVRGAVYWKEHMFSYALDDLRRSLELLRQNGAEGSIPYAVNEMTFASVLRDAGLTAQASEAESDAHLRLELLDRQGCSGCTISVESLRNAERRSISP